MREHATNIVRELRGRGFQAYFAGGCVRDTLLGVAPADYDVATDATPTDVMRIFPETYAPRRTIHRERRHLPSTRTMSRSRPSAAMAPTPTAVIPTRSAIPRIRAKTCSAAISPSTAC
jgi:tRNA nucleotidyltransferase/poly(A) polymerase